MKCRVDLQRTKENERTFMVASNLFGIGQKLAKYHLKFFSKIIDLLIRILFGCEIHSIMKCGKGLVLAHNGCGIVINKDAVIGNNVLIFQNVTIGGRKGSGSPIIGDDVIIGAGAVILGDITIGNKAKIGANAVVLKNVPPEATAVGVPAVIK